MTPKEKEIAVIDVILGLTNVEARKRPGVMEGYALFVRDIIKDVIDISPEDVGKIIRKLDRVGVISNPEFKRDLFSFVPKKLEDYKNNILLEDIKSKIMLDDRVRLLKFPDGTKWQNITIRFLDNDEVILEVKNKTKHTTYEELGFQDKRKKIPNKQWDLLKLLAIKQGSLSWDNNKELPLKQVNSIKKNKQKLAETLKSYFEINDEPFYDYRKEKAYSIKINLIPELNSTMAKIDENDDIGFKKYFDEQTPEINKDDFTSI